MKQETTTHTTTAPSQEPSSLSIVALVLGVVSLAGPGLILGIPAIVIGSIALKRKLGGRGLSIAGLITGIVSTVISLLFLLFISFLVVWGILHPDATNTNQQDNPWDSPSQTSQPYSSSQT